MPGLLRGMARTAAIVGTASAVSGGVQHRQQEKYAAQAQQAAQQAAAAEPAAVTPQDDMIAQIQQLSALKDQGILTEAEFDAKKKQILGI